MEIKNKLEKSDELKIAILGPEGTFSDSAYRLYDVNKTLEPVYYPTIDEVFGGVADEECELGIVPIENTLDGYVQRTLDLLLEKDVCIIDENRVAVQFSLLANADNIEEIDTLFVQFKANGQCRQFISSLKNIKLVTTQSNMESYYSIAGEKGLAAVVPAHIAKDEKEKFVIDNITDTSNNFTRFVVFTKNSISIDDINKKKIEGVKKIKIPVYIMPNVDRPGILYEILKTFYEKKINLISIMSRPTKQELGTYNFYIEIDGYVDQLDVIEESLKEIEKENGIRLLGIYKE